MSCDRFQHYTSDIEGVNVHFIHEKSDHPDAIPLLLLHGWPGTISLPDLFLTNSLLTLGTDRNVLRLSQGD